MSRNGKKQTQSVNEESKALIARAAQLVAEARLQSERLRVLLLEYKVQEFRRQLVLGSIIQTTGRLARSPLRDRPAAAPRVGATADSPADMRPPKSVTIH